MPSRFSRLSLEDRTFLRIEYPEAPEHVAGLCVLESGSLLDANGELDLAMIRHRLGRRLARVPQLRTRVLQPPFLGGPPLWVDDPAFSIERHIRSAVIAAPGDEARLLETTQLILRPMLDRAHPLWELWFLTGLEEGRLAALFKIHHAVADGLGAVALVASLLDLEPDASDPPETGWSPAPPPTGWSLATDNVSSRMRALAGALIHPLQVSRGIGKALSGTRQMLAEMNAAPRTSLNVPVSGVRHARVVHLNLEAARAVAHAHGAKVNDVLLSIIAGGLREMLVARGENVDGLELVAMVAATLRSAKAARELGNVTGAITVRLPIGETDAMRRLEQVAAATRLAKTHEMPMAATGLLALVAFLGLARRSATRQRMINITTTDVPGPQVPLYVLGARVQDVMAIVTPVNNVTLMFGALSYCGGLTPKALPGVRPAPTFSPLTWVYVGRQLGLRRDRRGDDRGWQWTV